MSPSSLDTLIQNLDARARQYETDTDVLDDELRELFEQELRRTLEDLLVAVPTEQEMAVRDCAHTLLGMGGVAGAPEISVLGEELSAAAKAHDWNRCAALTRGLEAWETRQANPANHPHLTDEETRELQGVILVVDDEEANRAYLRKILAEHGAEVHMAEDGEQALAMVPQLRPDLALVDVVMPGIQGYEVCDRIIHSPEMGQTSVIMVTALSAPADVENAFKKGAFDYIRKPFHSRELLARVRNALTLKRQTDALTLWKSRMSRELETAGRVQAKLFDATPEFGAGFDCQISYRPSQHIGGDMFDLLHLADGRCLTYLADVAGHGVGSALIATLIKGLAQEILSSGEVPALHEIANEIHYRFRKCVEDPELYATMLLVLWEPGKSDMQCLSCGHPPPLVFDADHQHLPNVIPATGGMPIGLMPPELGEPYRNGDVIHFKLPPSATLYLYTDGLTEAKTPERTECGEAGLLKALQICDGQSPELVQDFLNEQGYELQADDCTLMTLRQISKPALLMQGEREVSFESITSIASELFERLREQGWSEADAGMIQLLVVEHGANVVKHGHPPSGSPFFYRLHLEGNSSVLVLKDRGIAWNPTHWEPESTPGRTEPAESGRGLQLISEIASCRQYFRRDHQNCFVYRIDKNLSERLQTDNP